MLTKASKIAACLRNLKRLLYTENYSPPFYFRPFCPCYQQPKSNVLNYLFLNTIVSEQIQAWAKLFESVERRKLQGAKITLFTE